MSVVSVRELNANVSAIVARVEAGEVLTLTKHGRQIADIVPRQSVQQVRLAAISENSPPGRGSPEWQAAYDRMVASMAKGFRWGGRVTYDDKHE